MIWLLTNDYFYSSQEYSVDHLYLTWSTGGHQCLLLFYFVRDSSALILYFPKQRRICLSHGSWTEYCQVHTLATYKSFCLAGCESSKAKWPRSVAQLPLILERLHLLKLGGTLVLLGNLFLFWCHRAYNYRKWKGSWGNKSAFKYASNSNSTLRGKRNPLAKQRQIDYNSLSLAVRRNWTKLSLISDMFLHLYVISMQLSHNGHTHTDILLCDYTFNLQ